MSVPRATGVASTSRNLRDPNIMQLDRTGLVQNENGNKPNDKIINETIYSKTQGIQDVCEITAGKQALTQEKNAETSCMTSGYRHSLNIREDSIENESQWNSDIFQGSQKNNAKVDEAFLSNECQSNRYDILCSKLDSQSPHIPLSVKDSRGFNTLDSSRSQSDPHKAAIVSSDSSHNRKRSASNYISMNKTNPDDKIFNSKIVSKRGKDVSDDRQHGMNKDKTLGLNETSQIAFHKRGVVDVDGQHIESHYDVSLNFRKANEPCNIPDVSASNSFCYSGGIFESSVSSGCHRDENNPNVVGKMSQSFYKGEIKSTKYEEVKALICGSCKEDISQQVAEENILEYVDSLYYNREGTNLVFHRSTHVPKTTCNICGKEHAVENSHKNEHSCPVPDCTMTFPCRTRFYQHIPEHRKYFNKHCWVCIRTFKEHVTENDFTTYVCCVCGFPTKYVSSLKNHNILHLPRCSCKICEKEYHADDYNFHGSEVKCFVCNYVFKCLIQLREHFEAHVKYFSEHCRIREGNIENPLFRSPFDNSFHTSKDFFQYHLYEHAKLVFFDCGTCGRLFSKIPSLNKHKETCKALPYECEICETRFSTINLLHSHGLVKHKV